MQWNERRKQGGNEQMNEPNLTVVSAFGMLAFCECLEICQQQWKIVFCLVCSFGCIYFFNFQFSIVRLSVHSFRSFVYNFFFSNSNRWWSGDGRWLILLMVVLRDNAITMFHLVLCTIYIVWRRKVMFVCVWTKYIDYKLNFFVCHFCGMLRMYVCTRVHAIGKHSMHSRSHICMFKASFTKIPFSVITIYQHYDEDVKTIVQREWWWSGDDGGSNSGGGGGNDEDDDIDVIWIIHQQCN